MEMKACLAAEAAGPYLPFQYPKVGSMEMKACWWGRGRWRAGAFQYPKVGSMEMKAVRHDLSLVQALQGFSTLKSGRWR